MHWDTTFSEHPKISLERFQQVEKEINVQFPADFRDVVLENNEGSPNKKDILVGDAVEVFHNLLSFHPKDETYIMDFWKILKNEHSVPFPIVPIAEDPFGNYFCYDFRKDAPEIVFYTHDFEGDDPKAYSFVRSSFTELVQSLHNSE